MKLKRLFKNIKIAELQKLNSEKAMFDAEKAESDFRKEIMHGEKDNQETSKEIYV